jgi:signal transduction histidine kinase
MTEIIARHAPASQVNVRLRVDTETAVMEVQDDGVGFQVPERWIELTSQEHPGLVGAVERAESLGGRVQVVSSPGIGLTFRVSLPRDA